MKIINKKSKSFFLNLTAMGLSTFLIIAFMLPAFAYVSVSTSASVIPEAAPDETGSAALNNSSPELVVASETQALSAIVESGTSNPTINLHKLCQDNSAISPAVNIRSANAYNINLKITEGTFFTGNGLIWNCILNAPTVTTINLPETAGAITTLSKAIEVGHDDLNLSFDKAVRLLFPNDFSKKVGYAIGDTSFIEILSLCNGDSGYGLDEDEDCKINIGDDLVVWTRHFTKFATFSVEPIVSNNPPESTGSSGSSIDTAPTLGISPVIVVGGKIVTTRNINLLFNVSNADEVMISENANYNGANWEDYNGSSSFTLSDAYGNKVLHLKFRSASGSEVSTQIVVNYVAKKTTAPTSTSVNTSTSTNAVTSSTPIVTLNPNSTLTTVPDATHSMIITEPGIKLFDIILTINDTLLNKAKDLIATTEFTSFGTVPTSVKMNYRIEDNDGREVFNDSGEVIVETERLVSKDFTKLDLKDGKYTLFLTTVYGENITDEFKQTFEVKETLVGDNKFSIGIWLVLIFGLLLISGSFYKFIKRKKEY
jgi:hypothetical protein